MSNPQHKLGTVPRDKESWKRPAEGLTTCSGTGLCKYLGILVSLLRSGGKAQKRLQATEEYIITVTTDLSVGCYF